MKGAHKRQREKERNNEIGRKRKKDITRDKQKQRNTDEKKGCAKVYNINKWQRVNRRKVKQEMLK